MNSREISDSLAAPPPVAVATHISPPQTALAPTRMAAGEEATRHKKRKRKEPAEVAVAPPPPSPRSAGPQAGPSIPRALGTLSPEVPPPRRKKQEAGATAESPLLEAAGSRSSGGDSRTCAIEKTCSRLKRRKRINDEEAAASPSLSAAFGAPILEGENKATATKGRKQQRRGKENQEQSCKPPLPVDVHPQGLGDRGGELATDGPKGKKSLKRSISKKPRVPSTHEFIRMRLQLRKEQPLPPGILPATEMMEAKPSPHHSSPFGAFFDQFCYKPNRQQDYSTPPLPKTPDRPARPPPRAHPSSESSQLTSHQTSKGVKAIQTSVKRSRSASARGLQVKVTVKGKKKPEKKAAEEKQPRRKPPSLTAAERRSDKYRRLKLDELVPPPRSRHKLLQEKYASDPWKVIVICMLLNLTQGKQVRKKVKGFFKRYPDAQTAYNADPTRMAAYLKPLGLQHVKTKNIQKFSKAYVEKEWTFVTELCGVGKYAADAYAIFCAGRATEVVPEDHKLVEYWKYVCFELPMIEESQSAQEAGVTGLEKVEQLQELAASCS